MVGITTAANTATNQLIIPIPDNLKGIDLQVIVLPAHANGAVEFFSKEELAQFSTVQLGNPIPDDEDYSKW